MRTSHQLRQEFLDFFRSKDHQILPGISLIPTDPSLLLTGAGVIPFRDFIEGRAKPTHRRAVTCQRCVRDNDTERVGLTARHLTFFEMLGNFSFGDYYKEGAILWGWEFLTQVACLDAERLWAAVYLDDQQASDIWEREVGLPTDRIVALGREDNWWGPVAETGACGPCSEMYLDLGPQMGCGEADCAPGCDCDRFLEIWNLVFTEYYRNEDGSFSPLPTKNIDTGLGLERLALAVQGKASCFETDLFAPLVSLAADIAADSRPSSTENNAETAVALRIISDHARSFTFMIGDGILPSNEGRGYVLRRLMRRAISQGRRLGIQKPFLARLVPKIVELMSPFYTELSSAEEHIQRVTGIEEERFRETIETGWQRLEEMIRSARAQGKATLAGDDVFRLHDTYGFPLHLTQEVAEQAGLQVDEEGFQAAMQAQREASLKAVGQASGGSKVYADILQQVGTTDFLGYEDLSSPANVVAVLQGGERATSSSLENVEIILDRTPFYAESGGQVGDTGQLEGETVRAEVLEAHYGAEGLVVHSCRLLAGEVRERDVLQSRVEPDRRAAVRRSHTATHLLHHALRETLGKHVAQSGSLVEPDAFRFDFSHFGAPSGEHIQEIEALVNEKVLQNHPVRIETMSTDQARSSGAIALFGEKYGATVRVVQVGDFSKELCGGTHVAFTGEIGCFRLLSEGSIGSGLRRLTAITGLGIRRAWLEDEDQWARLMQMVQASSKEEVAAKVASLQDSVGALSDELDRYRSEATARIADDLAESAVAVGPFRLVVQAVDSKDRSLLDQLCDQVSAKTAPSLVFLAAFGQDTLPLVCKVSAEIADRGLHAGKIVGQVASAAGGKGGGRPLFAKGAARDASRLPTALTQLKDRLQQELKG